MTHRARLRGVAASIGVAVGPARLIDRGRPASSRESVDASEVDAEVARFSRAVAESLSEIEAAKQQLAAQHGSSHAPILDVHLLMHRDPLFIDAIEAMIRNERVDAQWALAEVANRLKKPFLESDASYFRERAEDIEHVRQHLMRHLRGERRQEAPVGGPVVLLAHDLTPADAVHMLAPPTIGLVTEAGARSSHTAILARTFGVPAVVGVGPLPPEAEDGQVVVVDGFSGEVTLGASHEERREAEERQARFVVFVEFGRDDKTVRRSGLDLERTDVY